MIQEFVQQINDTISENLKGIHTAFPGTIAAYDTSTGLATVTPSMVYKKPDGTTMAYPQITGVPVVIPQSMSQSVTIAYPIKEGDGCLVIVAEQSIDLWLYGQETGTDLAFDLTNAICIPGLFAEANAIEKEACDEEAVIIDVEGTQLKLKDGETAIDTDKLKIDADELKIDADEISIHAGAVKIKGDVSISGNLTLTDGIVNLN